MTVPLTGPPIPSTIPPAGNQEEAEQLAALVAATEAEAAAQEEIAANLVEQILLIWLAFSVLSADGGGRPGSQFYDGVLVADFGRDIARLVIEAQRAAGQVTEAYLREQIAELGYGRDLPTSPIVDLPEDLRLGAETADVYQRPIRQLRYLDSVEGVPLEEAVETARERLDRQAATDLQLARTISMQQVMYRFPQATGWRRIIHPELGNVCGLCIAAADRIYQRIEKMDLHPGCKCSCLPVLRDYDPGLKLNQEDLRRIYEAAGGTATERLREIRIEVQENSELGPILTPRQSQLRGPAVIKREMSERSRQLRREQLERQIAELRARPTRSQWFDDRIEQLEELLRTA